MKLAIKYKANRSGGRRVLILAGDFTLFCAFLEDDDKKKTQPTLRLIEKNKTFVKSKRLATLINLRLYDSVFLKLCFG